MSSSFESISLSTPLKEALQQVGYTEMTPIQAEALPILLTGRDVTGQAKTGSGKTAAFGLGLLNTIDPECPKTQALVLCPTRELADQVATELRRLSQRMNSTRVMTVCGGQPYGDQKLGLKRGCHVVVGTPGRVGSHMRKGNLDARQLNVLVLDEADRILDMGFIEQVTEIVDQCPQKRQTLLFSATFPKEITALCEAIQTDPVFVAVDATVDSETLQQWVYECPADTRNQTLVNLLANYRPDRALVFCETRRDCDTVARFLTGRGAIALPIHGLMEQRDRNEALLQFSNGSASILVATNVAARGIDIPSLPVVIIAELSSDPESHLHRIGRTGRAGEDGLALSLVCSPQEKQRLQRIEDFLGESIPRGTTPEPAGGLEFLKPPNQTLLLLAGRKDKLRKGDVLGAFVKEAGIPFEAIGRMDLADRTCAVAISNEYAQEALRFMHGGRIKKMRVRAQLLR